MDTKEKILKIAKKEFAKNGYSNTSLDKVAKKIGVSKPAIYYYFKSKKALYNEIFKRAFEGFKIELCGDLEEDLKRYINSVFNLFKDTEFAKIFSMELSNSMKNLEEDTLKKVSFLLKTLSEILKPTHANPFFIQTLIVSSTLTYLNTLELRSKVSSFVECSKLQPDFNLKEELTQIILKYVKEHL
jgi:AcrR family transcriptional regulator